MAQNRTKLLVVYDVDGWAQHRHASGLQKHAPGDIGVHIVPHSTYANRESYRESSWFGQYSAVYVISLALANRKPGVKRIVSCVASHAWMYRSLDRDNWRTHGVNPDRCWKVGTARLTRLDAATARNHELAKWGRRFCANVEVFPAGVDREVFYPSDFRNDVRQLRVGWCAQTGGITSFKGHDEILEPLRRELPQYDWSVNTRMYSNALSPQEMADWYRSLDVFLCTSSNDGTPNPPFEAAACGVPVVSTDVGQVSDWQAMRESGMMVPSYGNEQEAAMTRMLIAGRLSMLEDPDVRREHRKRLLESIVDVYDYAKLAPRMVQWILTGNLEASDA